MTAERIPIMQLGSCLLTSIQIELHDRVAMQFADDITARVVQTGARGVLIEISAVDLVDSFMGRMLGDLAASLGVLDATTVIVGMQPAVAITLVELGLSLDGLLTAMDVDQGMAMLGATAGGEGRPSGR